MATALLTTFRCSSDPSKANNEMQWLATALAPVVQNAQSAQWLINGEALRVHTARLLLQFDDPYQAQDARNKIRGIVEGSDSASGSDRPEHGLVPDLSEEPTYEILREENPQDQKGFVWRGFVWR